LPDLGGRTIAITGQRRADEMAELVRRLGGNPYIAPTVSLRTEESGPEAERLAGALLEGVDWAVFYTGIGVRSIFEAAGRLNQADALLEKLKLAKVLSRGRKSLRALREINRPPDFTAKPSTTSGVIDVLLKATLKDSRVFIQTPGEIPEALQEALPPSGVLIHGSPYRILPAEDPEAVSRLIKDLLEGAIDVITFTSPPAVNNLFIAADEAGQADELAEALSKRLITASIGPVTSVAIRENGVEPALEAESQRMGGLIQDLSKYLAKTNGIERENSSLKN
jgi:uroporphyrinogen-III synthase